MQASIAPRVPLYPPGAPGLGQPLFYGQPPPGLVPQVRRNIIVISITVNHVLVHLFCYK